MVTSCGTTHGSIKCLTLVILRSAQLLLSESNALESEAYSRKMSEQQNKSQNKGLQGVPVMIFNDERLLTGAQDKNVYLELLTKYIS
ncbi:DsbA family protein [Shewanella sp.]|uniref:DsbA family protein n=1 Tax=Shewanella sp. TaxID=50422 RepID=UPI004048E882